MTQTHYGFFVREWKCFKETHALRDEPGVTDAFGARRASQGARARARGDTLAIALAPTATLHEDS